MDPESKPAPGGSPSQEPRIPNTDMQPEDAGTSRSGNEDDDPRAAAESARPASESATKQTSKTDTESGGKGR